MVEIPMWGPSAGVFYVKKIVTFGQYKALFGNEISDAALYFRQIFSGGLHCGPIE